MMGMTEGSLTLVALMGLSPHELIIVGVILVVLFGATRIPELGSSIGLGIRNFKKGLKQIDDDEDQKDAKPKALASNEVKELPVEKANEK